MQSEKKRKRLKLAAIGEISLAILGFVWLVLLIIDLTYTLSPFLLNVMNIIWGIFIIDFLVRLVVAHRKLNYLKSNWLAAIALFIPALRMFRIFRAFRLVQMARTTRSLRMLRLFTSFRRSIRALSTTMQRRGFPYVVILTFIVAFAGAAGMFTFENHGSAEPPFTSYWHALWWTAMLLTTVGSDYWPVTPEGRILSLILAVYGVSVLGYIAAFLVSYFVEQKPSTPSR